MEQAKNLTVLRALAAAHQRLAKAKNPSPALDAEVLLALTLKKPREFIYTYPEKKLSSSQINKLNGYVGRRLKGEPIAYIGNRKEFYGREFYVDKNVLIPRPETELLIEELLKIITSDAGRRPPVIADIGTGSGCIAITLKKCLPKTEIIATDISQLALNVAKKNAKKHRAKIRFFRGNLLAPLKNIKFDIIIANLPYGEKKRWSKKTNPGAVNISFEPKIALYAKNSGLNAYQDLFRQVAGRKFPPKIIIIEIDPSQASALRKIAKKYFGNKIPIQIKKDLAGRKRLIVIKFDNRP
jgi:release factor glutamine methyltransferase